jgi:hypothetical protein
MRADSRAGRVVALLSRRAPVFEPLEPGLAERVYRARQVRSVDRSDASGASPTVDRAHAPIRRAGSVPRGRLGGALQYREGDPQADESASPGHTSHVLAWDAGTAAGGPSAELSLPTAYATQHGAWVSQRRRAARSALWFLPAAVALGVAVGASTRIPVFGLLFLVPPVWAVLDVMFRKPDRPMLARDRMVEEPSTGRLLRLAETHGGATVLHDRLLTGVAVPFEAEHVVVSPRGVFLIESKQWHGAEVGIVGPSIHVNYIDRAPMLKQLADHARTLGEALSAGAACNDEVGVVTVVPVLVVHADDLHGTPCTIHGVILVAPPQLPATLRSPDVRWAPQAVTSLVEAANLLLIPKELA